MNIGNTSFYYNLFFITNLSISRKILVINREDNNPIFSLLNYFISLTIYDNAFEAESVKDVQNIFWVKMPAGKPSLTLK